MGGIIRKGEVICLTLSDFSNLESLYGYWAKNCAGIVIVTSRLSHEQLISRVPSLCSDNVFFIDCVSRTLDPACKSHGVIVPGATALTEIAINLTKFLKAKRIQLVVIDSLSSLIVFNDVKTVIKFAHDISLNVRNLKCSLFLPVLDSDIDGDLAPLKLYTGRIDRYDGKNGKFLPPKFCGCFEKPNSKR